MAYLKSRGKYKVTQRTADGKFDCTNLLAQWNSANKSNPKKITEYLRLKETKEFVKALLEEPEFKGDNYHLLDNADYKDFPKSIIVVTRGKNGGTWMHPRFKYDVIKSVRGQEQHPHEPK